MRDRDLRTVGEVRRNDTDLRTVGDVLWDRIAELEKESAERMRRIQKLLALCHEYGIPMERVLDTGLREGE